MQENVDGRKQALTSMVEAYGQELYRFCCVQLRDAHLAQDAVQETFLRAFRYYESFRHECSEKTWLFTICVRVCRNLRRSAWFRLVDRSVQAENIGSVFVPEGNDLFSAVMELDEKYRVCLVLHYYYGYKAQEIGTILCIPAGTVLTRLKRGREKLKNLLTEGGEEP